MSEKNERIDIEYLETKVRPAFGQIHIEAVYMMTHVKYGRINKYRVTAEIGGIQSHDPHFTIINAECANAEHPDGGVTSNDETLTEWAAAGLFDEQL